MYQRTNLSVLLVILVFCTLFGACEITAGKIIYVDEIAAGANDGSSWDNAYNFLQDALADANDSEKPVEIRLAQGIYKPNEGLMAIPEFNWRTTTFQLINGVTLKGGYAGLTEPDPNARDVDLYKTILNGDLAGNDMPNLTNNSENSYPMMTNCMFTGNRATNGGGMYCKTYNQTMLINCTFSGNHANKVGGAIYRESGYLTLVNCILWGNIPMDLSFLSIASYSNVPPIGLGSKGNISTNPLFVNPGFWDPNETPDDPNDDFWIDGDYHLKSEAGRWDPNSQSWIKDDITSPCIDAGDPDSPVGDEPMPNGSRINMGAYGGTPEASISTQDVNSVPNLHKASNPNPANETFIGGHTLSWTAGLNAVSHDVYFGPNIPTEFILNQTETEFDTGSLRHGVTYFWRIDEVDGQGNKTTGDLWRFNTIPPKGRACFTGQTGVWVDGALIPISTVDLDRNVGCIDGSSAGNLSVRLPSLGKVETVQEHKGTFVCYDVLLESGNCISVAENHYFMEESGRWIALQNLTAGTRLRTSKGSIGIVSVTKRPVPYAGKVYNLKVKGSDRYLVGEDAVIVRDY